MVHLRFATTYPAPVKALRALHASSEAIHRLTPWPIHVKLQGELQVQAGAELRVKPSVLGLPLPQWHVRIVEADESGFVDEALTGPFRTMRHRHGFSGDQESCTLVDEIWIEPHRWQPAWAVKWAMQGLFAFRHRVTGRLLVRSTP